MNVKGWRRQELKSVSSSPPGDLYKAKAQRISLFSTDPLEPFNSLLLCEQTDQIGTTDSSR